MLQQPCSLSLLTSRDVSLACLLQVVFGRKLLVLIVSVWFPPVTSMTTRALSLAFIVLLSLVLHCALLHFLSMIFRPPLLLVVPLMSENNHDQYFGYQVITTRFRPYLLHQVSSALQVQLLNAPVSI